MRLIARKFPSNLKKKIENLILEKYQGRSKFGKIFKYLIISLRKIRRNWRKILPNEANFCNFFLQTFNKTMKIALNKNSSAAELC